ncbi:MAG: 50S ribosomal protein L23 [Rickettsiales bacterium]|jgi:large subunit ribosomal protein L23|nr:50S ribosomal protein L23 [Rickettsiales bacterium]|tara:strand:+ start:89 stop:394 length:306 start_codon:yes stop_codon:yes gene_type:complete
MTVLSSEKLFEVIRSPLISEKATFISQFNYYVFKVSPSSNKLQIKEAVEKVFNVKVKSVNTLVQKGKKKKFRNKIGVRADTKKAFVKLESGNSIDTTVEIK